MPIHRVHSKEDAAGVHNALNDMTRRLQHHVSDLKQATSGQFYYCDNDDYCYCLYDIVL